MQNGSIGNGSSVVSLSKFSNALLDEHDCQYLYIAWIKLDGRGSICYGITICLQLDIGLLV